ncbi:MAG TPA: DALR anticodon-binding domain-containing protein [Chroococcidiopsis sp.]
MSQTPDRILVPSLRNLLACKLQLALELWQQARVQAAIASGLPPLPSVSPFPAQGPLLPEIPLNQVKDVAQIWYVSAIALRLSPQVDCPPLPLSEQLAIAFEQALNSPSCPALQTEQAAQREHYNAILCHSACWSETPGWWHWRLTDSGVALWLQTVVDGRVIDGKGIDGRGIDGRIAEETIADETADETIVDRAVKEGDRPPQLHGNFTNRNKFLRNSTKNLFALQHAHARCWSLLRLGEQEGLMAIAPLSTGLTDPEHLDWAIERPSPLPWLDDTTLRCSDPAEQQLITQLVVTCDCLAEFPALPPERILKQAIALCRCFQAFDAQCRIVGAIAKTDPQRAQVRLGLIGATQKFLRALLMRLGAIAPLEL